MLAPIHSIKHYAHFTNTLTASAATRGAAPVVAVQGEAIGSAVEVNEGSVIKAVFIEVWLQSQATAGNTCQFAFVIVKTPAGAANISASEMLNLGAYDNKKNILFVSQGVLGDLNTQAVPIHRGWVKIPKGKQRFGLGDRLVWMLAPIGFGIQSCGISTYKEYR